MIQQLKKFQYKKLALLLAASSLFLSSCVIFQSKEHRAQNHLSKAISLDPSILKSKDSIRIKDSVVLKDTTIVHVKDSISIVTKDSTIIIPKSDLNGTITNPCDSIKGLQPFDYNLGSGVHKLHIWSDGKFIRYNSTVDSLISTIHSKDTYVQHLEDSLVAKEAAFLKEKESFKKDVITVVKYRAPIWQILMYLAIGGGAIYALMKFRVIK